MKWNNIKALLSNLLHLRTKNILSGGSDSKKGTHLLFLGNVSLDFSHPPSKYGNCSLSGTMLRRNILPDRKWQSPSLGPRRPSPAAA